jgi:hypothetical protein
MYEVAALSPEERDSERVVVDENAELRATVAALASQVGTHEDADAERGHYGGPARSRDEQVDSGAGRRAAGRDCARLPNGTSATTSTIRVSASTAIPKGDRARQRPPFKCKMFWVGFDMDWDTTTAQEIELLNQMEPGDYTFRRIGGAPEELHVTGERNASGKLTKLSSRLRARSSGTPCRRWRGCSAMRSA